MHLSVEHSLYAESYGCCCCCCWFCERHYLSSCLCQQAVLSVIPTLIFCDRNCSHWVCQQKVLARYSLSVLVCCQIILKLIIASYVFLTLLKRIIIKLEVVIDDASVTIIDSRQWASLTKTTAVMGTFRNNSSMWPGFRCNLIPQNFPGPMLALLYLSLSPLPSITQHLSYDDCLEVRRKK